MMRPIEINARIANPPEGLLAKYTRKEKDFFFDYAGFILRSISSPQVGDGLRKLVQMEGVNINRTVDLRVMVFPARPLSGRPRNILHGSYNQDFSQISLYPLKFPREWIRGEGFSLFKTPPAELSPSEQKILSQIFESSVSTLIHEVLHVKFHGRNLPRYVEEAIVRKLEKQYAHELLDKLDQVNESLLGESVQDLGQLRSQKTRVFNPRNLLDLRKLH